MLCERVTDWKLQLLVEEEAHKGAAASFQSYGKPLATV